MISPLPISDTYQEQLIQLWDYYGGKSPSQSVVNRSPQKREQPSTTNANTCLKQDDVSIIERIKQENGPLWDSLNNGRSDSIKGADTSDSAIDMKLVGLISHYTESPEQMERIWLSTPHGRREKTQKRQDYRTQTIENVMKNRETLVDLSTFKERINSYSNQEGPQPLRRVMPPTIPFPVDALGPLLSQSANAITDIVQCPLALAGVALLATTSLAVQAACKCRVPRNRTHKTIISVCIIYC